MTASSARMMAGRPPLAESATMATRWPEAALIMPLFGWTQPGRAACRTSSGTIKARSRHGCPLTVFLLSRKTRPVTSVKSGYIAGLPSRL